MCTRTQEKGAVTPQETDPDLPGSVHISSRGVGRRWPDAGLGAVSVAVHAWDLLKEVAIIFITSTIVWAQAKSRVVHPSIENWVKDLLSMALPIRTRPNFPLSQSLPSESFHKASYPSPSEGRQTENHSHRKLTNLVTWTRALSNSVKL